MRALIATIVYLAVVAVVVLLNPSFLFDDAANLKSPGLAQDGTQSVLAAAIFFPLLAAFIYYVTSVLLFSKKRI